MVFPASHGISRVPRYSGAVSRKSSDVLRTGLSPSLVVLSRSLLLRPSFLTSRGSPETVPQPPRYFYQRFGVFPFRSPLLVESRFISVPRGTEMFHFPLFAFCTYEFSTE